MIFELSSLTGDKSKIIAGMETAWTGKAPSAGVDYSGRRREASAEYASHECFHRQPHRRSAQNVERQVCSDVNAAQADRGNTN